MTADDLRAIDLLDELEDALESRVEMVELMRMVRTHLMSCSDRALVVDQAILEAAQQRCREELAQIH
jgi:hypothetical protein